MSKLSDMHDSKLISENNVKAYAEKLAKLFEGTIPVPDLKVRTSREPIEHLKSNQKAIYVFSYKGRPLKIGIAGPNSYARLAYQHYSPHSCRSNLAQKLINYKKTNSIEESFDEQNIKDWIKENCERFDLIYTDIDIWTLKLLEAAMHYEYKPLFEGRLKNFKKQK